MISSMPESISWKIWMAPSWAIWVAPFTNCLRFMVSFCCTRLNSSGARWGYPRTPLSSPARRWCPRWRTRPVEHADDVPGVGLLDDLPLGGHELLGPGEAELLLPLDVVDLLVRLEVARAHPEEGDPVPVGLVHVGLDFKHKGGEVGVEGVHHAWAVFRGRGEVVSFKKLSRKGSTPKLVRAEPKNTGESLPWRTFSKSKS